MKFKRLLAILLCLTVVVSSVLIGSVVSAQPSEIEFWQGDIASSLEGEGTEEKPYLISNGAELAFAVKSTGGHYYKLTKDIYLNDLTKIDWQTGEVDAGYEVKPWIHGTWTTGNYDTKFKGTLDGDGHTVYGMYYKDTDTTKTYYYVGLIPGTTSSATVKNIGVDNAYLYSGNGWVSAFVAYNKTDSHTVTIDNCYAGKNVSLYGSAAGVAWAYGQGVVNISNFYSKATVTTKSNRGIVANTWNKTTVNISNAYILDCPVSTKYDCNLANVYSNVTDAKNSDLIVLSKTLMQGKDALTATYKMNALGDKFVSTAGYPSLASFPATEQVFEGESWDGVATKEPIGEGTDAQNPKLISTAAELAWAVQNTSNYYYVITNDIYLNDITKINWQTGEVEQGYTVNSWIKGTWTSGSYDKKFKGTIDGQGHTVYGMYYKDTDANAEYYYIGLIPAALENITVKNLGMDNSYITSGNGWAAAIIGYSHTSATIINVDNCYVGENVTVESGNIAGAVYGYGKASLTISNVYSKANLNDTTADEEGKKFEGLVAYMFNESAQNQSKLNISNAYILDSGISPKYEITSVSNVYTNVLDNKNWKAGLKVLSDKDLMQGEDVFTNANKMPNLANTSFKATSSYPELELFYQETEPVYDQNDYNKDGKVDTGDLAALRAVILAGNEDYTIINLLIIKKAITPVA